MESTDKSVEEAVLNILQKGTLLGTEIVRQTSLLRTDTTKQAVYRVLRKLKKEEKIVIHGKSVSLNAIIASILFRTTPEVFVLEAWE